MRIDVLIIGGGCTGAGIARDMALRGASVLLLEKGDFCHGASGGNHGMLHSGGRYVVKDPGSAKECAEESKILRRIAAHCIEDAGGLFVGLDQDDPSFADRFQRSCRSSAVEADEVTPDEARRLEPSLSEHIVRAFSVNDGSVDPFRLVLDNVRSARAANATVRNHCQVTGMTVESGRIVRASYRDDRNGSVHEVEPEMVVNAAGAWADQVAMLAGCRAKVQMDFGALVVLNGRPVDRLINRLRMPTDGDIIVPNHTSTIAGTTSRNVDRAEGVLPTREEVEKLVREASALVPGIRSCRAIRAYGGVRPLISSDGRDASREYRLIDHAQDGVDNLVSVIGGKLTTYRLMAERTSDHISQALGLKGTCQTANEPLLTDVVGEAPAALPDHLSRSLDRRYGPHWQGTFAGDLSGRACDEICTCEVVARFELGHFAKDDDVLEMADLLRRTRAGMGYCQGLACSYQMLGELCSAGRSGPGRLLADFLKEREKARSAVLDGDQLRQEVMRAHILANIDLEEDR